MENSADEEKNYKRYCESESNEAYSLICKNQEEYDKQLLTLSTGMLAILFAFLKDLVHLDSSICRPILYVGLTSLALTVAAVIFSFQLSIRALEQVRSHWKEHYDGNREHQFPDKLGNCVKYINWGAGGTFFIGIALALSFIIINISHQANAKESTAMRTGSQMSTNSSSAVNSEERGSGVKSPLQSPPKTSSPETRPSSQQQSSSKK